jgi:hypothetical protein
MAPKNKMKKNVEQYSSLVETIYRKLGHKLNYTKWDLVFNSSKQSSAMEDDRLAHIVKICKKIDAKFNIRKLQRIFHKVRENEETIYQRSNDMEDYGVRMMALEKEMIQSCQNVDDFANPRKYSTRVDQECNSGIFEIPDDCAVLKIKKHPLLRRKHFLSTLKFSLDYYFFLAVRSPQLYIKLLLILNKLVQTRIDNYTRPVKGFVDIEKPHDLSSIKTKLENKYEDPWEFISDINLIFENCFKYYHKTSKIFKFAREVSSKVLSIFRIITTFFSISCLICSTRKLTT